MCTQHRGQAGNLSAEDTSPTLQIVIILHESQEWRKLVREEGELWRGLTKEIVHDIGFI